MNQLDEVDGARWGALAAREVEQLAHDLGALHGEIRDRRCCLPHHLRLTFHEPDVEQDGGEEIVEIMGDPARQRADRLHLLRVANPGLRVDRLSDVPHHQDRVFQSPGRGQGAVE